MTGRTNKGIATAKLIKLAILRIKSGRPKVVIKNRKISVAAVAEECGLSRASLHKDYPELVDQIKAESGKDVRAQRDKKNIDLKSERQKSHELRVELAESKANNLKLVSINAALAKQLEELRLISNSKNVTVLGVNKHKQS